MVVSRSAPPCLEPIRVLWLSLLALLALGGPAQAGSSTYELVVLAEPRAPSSAAVAGDLTLSYRVVEVFAGEPGSVSIVVTHRELAAEEARWLQLGVRVILLARRDPEAPGRWQAPFPVKATPKAVDSFRRWSAPPDVREPRAVDEVVEEARREESGESSSEAEVSPSTQEPLADTSSPGRGSAPGPPPSTDQDTGPSEVIEEVAQEDPPRIEDLPEPAAASPEVDTVIEKTVAEREPVVADAVVEVAVEHERDDSGPIVEPGIETEHVEPREGVVALSEDPAAPQLEDTVWDAPAEESVNLLGRPADETPVQVARIEEAWEAPAAFPSREADALRQASPTYMTRRQLSPDPGPGLPPVPTSSALGPSLANRSDLRVVRKRD